MHATHAPDPEASDGPAPRRGRWLGTTLLVLWVALHGLGLWAKDFRMQAPHPLLWGAPDLDAMIRHGALVPALVAQGEWQRLLTGPGLLGAGVLSLLLGLWMGVSALRFLEQAAGSARALLVLVSGTLAAGCAQTWWFAPGSTLPHVAGWDLILAAVGARLTWGLATGGTVGRTAASSALAFAALTVALAYFTPGAGLIALRSEAVAFVTGALVLLLLGPRRVHAAPGAGTRALAALALLAVLGAAGLQARQALADPGTDTVKHLLTLLDRAEDAAVRLWRLDRDPARIPRSEREALGLLLDELQADEALPGLEGEAELRAFVAALRPLATGDLRDPSGVLARLQRAARAWTPREASHRGRHGLGAPEAKPWR